MTHRFLVKDIALQAGLGTATVDRVLNGRAGVRRQTAERVHHAIRELEAQAGQLAASGRKFIIDLVVEAPQTFRETLDAAIRQEMPLMQPASFRIRSDTRTHFPPDEMERALSRAARLGSHGVIVMAPDTGPIRDAIDRLDTEGIPVITLATDLPGTRRRAYVGLDNTSAGRTAAWFLHKWLARHTRPRILVTIRNDRFRGEEEREKAFRQALQTMLPDAELAVIVEGHDTVEFTRRVGETVGTAPPDGLYSIGGNNRLLLSAIRNAGAQKPILIGHDLDPDNRALLAEGAIDLILYHDLAEDIRNACRVVLAAHSRGAMPKPPDGAALRLAVPPMADPI
ncbi:MAG: LacI family DNA-binding transcriptional regulator [Albidovulum sp.]|uniref:LacI family DNA-binding transcriptional regulator n=1 Tax=Albidovulum sp. TaxID=1872424 RepID=UPI003CA6AF80